MSKPRRRKPVVKKTEKDLPVYEAKFVPNSDVKINLTDKPVFGSFVATKGDPIVNKQPTGLGDVVDNITTKTGVKKVVKALFGEDCGCNERKEKWNVDHERGRDKHKAYRCMTEEQHTSYGKYIETRTLDFRPDIQMIIDLYAHIYAIQYSLNVHFNCSSCGAAARASEMQKKLDKVYYSYEK